MSDETTIKNGATVYGEDGDELGVITGSTSDGFTVSINEGVEYVEETAQNDEGSLGEADERARETDEERREIELQEHDPGPEFGEGFLMWRCAECGEMGELDEGFPEECPNCGSGEVNKWKED